MPDADSKGAQSNDAQSNDAQSNDAQSNDAQSNDAQSNDAQSNDAASTDADSTDTQAMQKAAERSRTSDSTPRPAAGSGDPVVSIDLTEYGIALAEAIQAAMPSFVERLVRERSTAFGVPLQTGATPQDFAALHGDVTKLGQSVASAVDHALREFFISDIDSQRTTPLTIIRNHLGPVTEFLRSLSFSPADRDPFDVSSFPADVFALGPQAWQDFGEEAHEAGLRWGAAKAMVHRQRHVPRQ
jgi:hypothetical protein